MLFVRVCVCGAVLRWSALEVRMYADTLRALFCTRHIVRPSAPLYVVLRRCFGPEVFAAHYLAHPPQR